MLIVTRRAGESVVCYPASFELKSGNIKPGADLENGMIEFIYLGTNNNYMGQARIGIEAHLGLRMLRGELFKRNNPNIPIRGLLPSEYVATDWNSENTDENYGNR